MNPSNRAVFLSYAREDADSARRIAAAWRASGMEVWFDENELRGGEAWDAKIRRSIRDCTLFVPLVSAHTQARHEGYFRREWKLAVERMGDMASGVAFLVPVVIDGTREAEALVPEEFMRVQWTRLPGGESTPAFTAQVQRLLASPRAALAAPAARPAGHATVPAAPAAEAAPAPKSGRPPAAPWISRGAVAVAEAFGFLRRPPEKPAAPATPAVTEVSAAAAKSTGKSIAVLPFTNLSDEKDSAFFADGVHEDVLTNLSFIDGLRVVSRTSVLQYRGATKPIGQIAQELKVDYVLEGSVRRVGHKVRVTGQLIRAATDEHLWARNYDGELTDVFALQSQLAKSIADALQAVLSPQAAALIGRRLTQDPVAYDLYLRARAAYNQMTADLVNQQRGLDEVETLLKGAVQADPTFALGWADLAIVHARKIALNLDTTDGRLAQGDLALAKALQLSPDAPEVIRAAGLYAYHARRDYAQAIGQLQKAARLLPNDPAVIFTLGAIQRRQGNFAEALSSMRRACELEPANVQFLSNLRALLIRARRWDEAVVLARRIAALSPGDLNLRLIIASNEASASGSLAPLEQAVAGLTPAERESQVGLYWRVYLASLNDYEEFKRIDALHPTFEDFEPPETSATLACKVYLAQGEPQRIPARLGAIPETLRARLGREPKNSVVSRRLAEVEALLGNKEEAVRLVQQTLAAARASRDLLVELSAEETRARVFALVGDREAALAALAKCLASPGLLSVHDYRLDPTFFRLRGDPRFEALLNDPKFRQPLF